jgi:hypothetical protein
VEGASLPGTTTYANGNQNNPYPPDLTESSAQYQPDFIESHDPYDGGDFTEILADEGYMTV